MSPDRARAVLRRGARQQRGSRSKSLYVCVGAVGIGSAHTVARRMNQMATPVSTVRVSTYAQKARWATVRVETEGAVYVGRLYIPETKKRLSDVLCDDRPFLNMTDVAIKIGRAHV